MKVAFIFPGQGSQSVGMGQALAQAFPEARAALDEADAALGGGLARLIAEGPEEELRKTANTQPAILAVSVAAHRALQAQARGRLQPSFYAGHSLGEYSALVAAGALSLSEAVRAVRARGTFMQEAVPAGEGAMAAILGLEDAEVEAACREAAGDEVVEAVNYNSPGQLVIAGNTLAVGRAIEACKAKGAKRALLLPVSVPAHSSLLAGAGRRLAERLATVTLRPPSIPVYSIGLARHTSPDTIRANLVRQLSSPVRWSDTITDLVRHGATRIIECGSGKVLTSLNRRIERDRTIAMQAIEDPDSLGAALAAKES